MQQIRAKKAWWQNFLEDPVALEAIASAVDIEGKHIIEVWPWYGALTEFLLHFSPKSLDIVEIDPDMVSLLQKKYNHLQNISPHTSITLHHGDILQYTPHFSVYSVIANIPYYITSPILFHFLYPFLSNGNHHTPAEMVIMMQKEVAEKILGTQEKKYQMSFLSLTMWLACTEITPVCFVPREAFSPAPKVDSLVLRFHGKNHRDIHTETRLLHLWNQAFRHPRKTLIKNLKGSMYESMITKDALEHLGYTPQVRAEAIAPWDWHTLLNIS